jgi:hypothetical protein
MVVGCGAHGCSMCGSSGEARSITVAIGSEEGADTRSSAPTLVVVWPATPPPQPLPGDRVATAAPGLAPAAAENLPIPAAVAPVVVVPAPQAPPGPAPAPAAVVPAGDPVPFVAPPPPVVAQQPAELGAGTAPAPGAGDGPAPGAGAFRGGTAGDVAPGVDEVAIPIPLPEVPGRSAAPPGDFNSPPLAPSGSPYGPGGRYPTAPGRH